MFWRLRRRRVRGFAAGPLRLFRCRGGADGPAFRGLPFAVLCTAPPFTNRNCTLLGVAFVLAPLPTVISIPPDSSSTVIPFPRPTYCTACPAVPPAGSNVMGKEKFAAPAPAVARKVAGAEVCSSEASVRD